MMTGATWPTVFYNGSNSPILQNKLVASSLTPAGWSSTGLQELTGSPASSFVRTTAGSDGRIGATWLRENAIGFTQSSALGWQTTTVATVTNSNDSQHAPDVAYLSGNRPVVAYSDNDSIKVAAYDNLTWTTETLNIKTGNDTGTHVTMDVDSQDRVGLAYQTGTGVYFALRNWTQSTWSGTQVTPSSASHLSLAFGPNDQAGIAIIDGNDLSHAWFSTQLGRWVSDPLASGIGSNRVNLAFNSQGHPALSYVSEGKVHYRINEGSGWIDAVLPIGMDAATGLTVTPISDSEAVLAFDANDIPVIAYYGGSDPQNPQLLLAYDPPVAPEPTAALLAMFGLAGLGLRRRSA